MFPGKINPKQMQAMMRQMGIKTQEVPAKRVVIELENEKIIIEEPNVSSMTVQGQKTYTVVGPEKVEGKELEPSAEDAKMVMEQANCSEEDAVKALKETNGDIAQAIVKLKE